MRGAGRNSPRPRAPLRPRPWTESSLGGSARPPGPEPRPGRSRGEQSGAEGRGAWASQKPRGYTGSGFASRWKPFAGGPMHRLITNFPLALGEEKLDLAKPLAHALGGKPSEYRSVTLERRSLDARHKGSIRFLAALSFETDRDLSEVELPPVPSWKRHRSTRNTRSRPSPPSPASSSSAVALRELFARCVCWTTAWSPSCWSGAFHERARPGHQRPVEARAAQRRSQRPVRRRRSRNLQRWQAHDAHRPPGHALCH